MGQNEIKYSLITGEAPKWVSLTKGFLTGKITLQDLITAEIVSTVPDPETGTSEVDEITQLMAEQGQDPTTDVIFDIDWLVRVEAGSLAERDTQKDLQDFDSTIQAGQTMGVPLNMIEIWKERAMRAGIKEPEQYLMNQENQPQQPPMIGQTPVQVPQPTQQPMQPMQAPMAR